MNGFSGVGALASAQLEGAERITTWRKTPAVVTQSGFWFDLSMSSGNPTPNYYAAAPLVSKRLSQSEDGGIYHGPPVAPARKVLRSMLVTSTSAGFVPMSMILLDYLMFYPFCEEADTEEQTLVNSLSLSRYTDGRGVQIMPVVVAQQAGGQTIWCRYTNQDGVPDRISPATVTGIQGVNGTILTTARGIFNSAGPFMPLAAGDTGVRSIEGVFTSGGDVGLFTLVLVKPLATLTLQGVDAPNEVDYLRDQGVCPIIEDDAYLNLICLPIGSLSAAPIHGMAHFVWG